MLSIDFAFGATNPFASTLKLLVRHPLSRTGYDAAKNDLDLGAWMLVGGM
jgi:hypothetical protein